MIRQKQVFFIYKLFTFISSRSFLPFKKWIVFVVTESILRSTFQLKFNNSLFFYWNFSILEFVVVDIFVFKITVIFSHAIVTKI